MDHPVNAVNRDTDPVEILVVRRARRKRVRNTPRVINPSNAVITVEPGIEIINVRVKVGDIGVESVDPIGKILVRVRIIVPKRKTHPYIHGGGSHNICRPNQKLLHFKMEFVKIVLRVKRGGQWVAFRIHAGTVNRKKNSINIKSTQAGPGHRVPPSLGAVRSIRVAGRTKIVRSPLPLPRSVRDRASGKIGEDVTGQRNLIRQQGSSSPSPRYVGVVHAPGALDIRVA